MKKKPYRVILGEQRPPSGHEFRVAEHPQRDEDDEEDQNGDFMEGDGSQFLVLFEQHVADFMTSFLIIHLL